MQSLMAIDLPSSLIDRLRAARRIVAFTGAGISVESGLSTFRDKQTGLWAKYRPEDLATPQAFQRNPRMVWEWYEWRRGVGAKAEPNPGHHALAHIEAARPGFFLATQNVDGLHARAGSRNLVELHGNIRRTICFDHRHLAESWEPTDEPPPRCAQCGSLLRPDVVWFGELPYDLDVIDEALLACDVFAAIGTSGAVYPAAGYVAEAHALGIPTVELNLEPSDNARAFDDARYGPATEVVPAFVEEMLRRTAG